MLAFASRQARGLTSAPAGIGARAVRLGLFSFALPLALGTAAGCGPRDPHAVAAAEDAKLGTGVYAWLADHDPSHVVVVGLDPTVTRTVAPDSSVESAGDVAAGCTLARTGHAIFAALATRGTDAGHDAQDCGYVMFRDQRSIAVAPR